MQMSWKERGMFHDLTADMETSAFGLHYMLILPRGHLLFLLHMASWVYFQVILLFKNFFYYIFFSVSAIVFGYFIVSVVMSVFPLSQFFKW